MSDQSPQEPNLPDPAEFAKTMASIAEQSQRIVSEFLSHQQGNGANGPVDPLNIGSAFFEMTRQMMSDPAKLVQAQMSLWQDYMTLWQNTTRRFLGQEPDPVVAPEQGDYRFKDEAWDENVLFDFVKQSYLLTSRWIQNTVGEVEGLDDKTAQKIDFYTRQFVDAMAPT
ncbi:MAG: class I poly(R)-hydroxyalkanoic acid synthase, partial [Rhodospirillales bacterium]|nr:class I poly(R)-hydroxyalkanoic acid synthase [Rhodospirillales bacterium]